MTKFANILQRILRWKNAYTYGITLLVFGIRWLFCRSFPCAMSWGLTALLAITVANLVLSSLLTAARRAIETKQKQQETAADADKQPQGNQDNETAKGGEKE